MGSFDAIRLRFVLERAKFETGISAAKRKLNGDLGEMRANIDRFKSKISSASRDLQHEIPMLGRAFSLLKNPIVGVTAAVGALVMGMGKAVSKAEEFRSGMRGLLNLNADKDPAEQARLRRSVLNTAFAGGFDARKTATGYFDIQSATGLYGAEVDKIVAKQGEFAMLMQADFNKWIEGTGKAVANYGIRSKDMDDFNRSAYAAMKVGITTFDSLANVMSVYAGPAASSQQTFDTANKIYTLFTRITKSNDEAATLTKSFFNDLTKATTIKTLKDKTGIDLIGKDGSVKQADKLLLELNAIFARLGNKELINLKNQFTGSEGLLAFIQQATDKTGGMRQALQDFANSKLLYDRIVQIAEADPLHKQEQLTNKLNTALIELGETVMPLKLAVINYLIPAVKKLRDLVIGPEAVAQEYRDKGVAGVKTFESEFMESIRKDPSEANYGAWLQKAMSAERRNRQDLANTLKEAEKQIAWPDRFDFWLSDVTGTQMGRSKDQVLRSKTDGAYDILLGKGEALRELMPKMYGIWTAIKNNPAETGTGIGGPESAGPGTGTTTSLLNPESVTSSAKQIRNITVNIDAFNKGGINTQNTNLQHMDGDQIEVWFTDMCMRVVRNLELSY